MTRHSPASELLILDEPTAALNDEDSGRLLTPLLLDLLKAGGITSIITIWPRTS